MHDLGTKIHETSAAIRAQCSVSPRVGIILGSGLGRVAEQIQPVASCPYAALPNFPRSTAMGHEGRLLGGQLAGVPVITMQGRFHLYEGYSAAQVAFPVRVMKAVGAELLILTNAAGGLDPHFQAGDVMVISDHINLMFRNPLVGVNDDGLGPRFPEMCAPYDPGCVELALEIARRENLVAHCGVYVGMLGPSYETRAEYRFLRRIGGGAVGMSTVPEVIAAVHARLPVLGLSIIANAASPDTLSPTSGEEVVAVVQRAEAKVAKLIAGVITSKFN